MAEPHNRGAVVVHFHKYADRRHWIMWFFNPLTGRRVFRSSGETAKAGAAAVAKEWQDALNGDSARGMKCELCGMREHDSPSPWLFGTWFGGHVLCNTAPSSKCLKRLKENLYREAKHVRQQSKQEKQSWRKAKQKMSDVRALLSGRAV